MAKKTAPRKRTSLPLLTPVHAADERLKLADPEVESWPVEQRAGYFARRGMVELGESDRPRIVNLIGKINAIWEKWNAMHGDNRPLERSTAGPRREFDINLDGMAHYGMLPDFLQDVRNVGLTAQDLAPLFRSAYDYIKTWQLCVQRAEEMA